MLKKTQAKNGSSTKVTFELPAVQAGSVHLVGEFNEWSQTDQPLTRRKDGRFSTTVALASGRAYRYRYLFDGARWENDTQADAYVPNGFGTEDSVVQV